jgi:hypothetical protein
MSSSSILLTALTQILRNRV